MHRSCVGLLVVCSMRLYASYSVAVAGEAKSIELAGQSPILDSGDGKHHRIKVCGYMKLSDFSDVTFVARYHAPNRFMLCFADAKNYTPLVYINEGKMIIYNAIQKNLLYLSQAKFDFSFRFSEGRFRFKYAFDKSARRSNIFVDFKSVFAVQAEKNEVAREDEKTFQLTRATQLGQTVVAVVDSTRRCPFKNLKVTSRGETEPGIVIRELSVDDDVNEPWSPFPLRDRFIDKLPIKDLSQDDPFVNLEVQSIFESFFVGYVAIREKSLRDSFENNYHDQIVWDEVERAYTRVSGVIREVFGSAIDVEKGNSPGTGKP